MRRVKRDKVVGRVNTLPMGVRRVKKWVGPREWGGAKFSSSLPSRIYSDRLRRPNSASNCQGRHSALSFHPKPERSLGYELLSPVIKHSLFIPSRMTEKGNQQVFSYAPCFHVMYLS